MKNLQFPKNVEFNFQPNKKMYFEEISLKEFGENGVHYDIKFSKINHLFGGEKIFSKNKIAGLLDGYQYVSQKMMGNLDLKKTEVLVRAEEQKTKFFAVFGKREEGIVKIHHIEKNIPSGTSGCFYETLLIKSNLVADLPSVKDNILKKDNIKTKLVDNPRFKENYFLDKNNIFWKEIEGEYFRDVYPPKSVKRYLGDEIGTGVMSQAILNGKIISLLENGLLFDGHKILPKKNLPKKDYEYLVSLAEIQTNHWITVSTGDSWDHSREFDIHKDLSPCLFYIE